MKDDIERIIKSYEKPIFSITVLRGIQLLALDLVDFNTFVILCERFVTEPNHARADIKTMISDFLREKKISEPTSKDIINALADAIKI